MTAILIIGRLPENAEMTRVYETIHNVCEKQGEVVGTPIQTAGLTGTTRERYDRGMELIGRADLIVAECSKASTGQGMELREATIQDIPVVVLNKEGTVVSGMILGMPNLKTQITYKDVSELRALLERAMR